MLLLLNRFDFISTIVYFEDNFKSNIFRLAFVELALNPVYPHAGSNEENVWQTVHIVGSRMSFIKTEVTTS